MLCANILSLDSTKIFAGNQCDSLCYSMFSAHCPLAFMLMFMFMLMLIAVADAPN